MKKDMFTFIDLLYYNDALPFIDTKVKLNNYQDEFSKEKVKLRDLEEGKNKLKKKKFIDVKNR
jgi:hypothetical protein